MSSTHFGLRQRPFPATPDPSRYYPATSHERTLARLLNGLADGEGMLVLTGAPGTGKTLLCHCLMERLGSRSNTAFLTNSHVGGRAGLLQAILYDLSLPYEGRSEQDMRLALTDHLLKGCGEGKCTVLILDEAQHLPADLLEELRLLGNLEARSVRAVQVILVGQPSLLDTMRRPELASLWQRLAVRAELAPLALQEAADYLLHHLRIAGGSAERLFEDEALEVLSRQTHGIPRLLNQAAHQALQLAAESGAAHVDAEAALEALAMLGLENDGEDAASVPLLVDDASEEPGSVEAASDCEGMTAEEEDASCRLILASKRVD